MNDEGRRLADKLYAKEQARRAAATAPPQHKLTRAQRLSRDKVSRYLAEARLNDLHVLNAEMRAEVPEAWHTIEHDLDVTEKKVKVTLWLDTSTAKFYRAMGKGYQARINRILGLWAHLKIGQFLERERWMKGDWGI